ncbi:hypothetical protein GGGNBK_23120 (plasmid) [Sporosarcina sp. ANT_H38]
MKTPIPGLTLGRRLFFVPIYYLLNIHNKTIFTIYEIWLTIFKIVFILVVLRLSNYTYFKYNMNVYKIAIHF